MITGTIYKITYGNDFYIGSTQRQIYQDSIKFPNRLLYKTTKVEILEKKDYQNREEMEMVEKGLFKSLNPTLNKNKGTSKHYNHEKYMKNEKYKLKMREYMYNKVQEQKKLKESALQFLNS